MSIERFAVCGRLSRLSRLRRKKRPKQCREAARELEALLDVVFNGLRKSGHFDLEAVEMATRSLPISWARRCWSGCCVCLRTVRGANAIIVLRCHRLSAKFEDYWASRSQAA